MHTRTQPQIGVANLRILAVAGVAVLLGTSSDLSHAADWPQWRGIKRDGHSYEAGWMTNWPPTEIWRKNIGAGFSSVVVTEGRLYTAGYTTTGGNSNIVYCIDALTGTQIWTRAFPYTAGRDGGYPGPRGTPAVDGDRLYFFDHVGKTYCLNRLTGSTIWTNTLDLGRVSPGSTDWGYGTSPLVEGDLVIVNSGKGAAVNKYTGAIVWTNSGNAGYASPVPYTATNGERMVILFSSDSLNGLVATNGKRVWTYSWGTSYSCHAGDPVLYGSNVYISTGYGDGMQALVRIGTGTVSHIWRNSGLQYRTGSAILQGDYIYGIDCDNGGLKCVDVRDGTTQWTRTGFGEGAITAADGLLLVLDSGSTTVVRASHAGYTVVGSAISVGGSGECRTPPVLSNGRIYTRRQTRLVCYRAGPIPEADTDANGIPDTWQIKHFTNAANCVASDDSDGDGVSNGDEYRAGTDPTNVLSFLRMTLTTSVGGKLVFTTPTIKAEGTGYLCRARFYSMQTATGLTGDAWCNASDCMDVVGTNAPIYYTNAPAGTPMFYRMKVRLE